MHRMAVVAAGLVSGPRLLTATLGGRAQAACRAGGLLLNSPEEGDEELHQVHDAVVLRESDLEEDRRRKTH